MIFNSKLHLLFFNTVSSLLIKLLAICKCLSMQQRRKEPLGLLVAMSMWTQLNSLNGRLSWSPVLIALFHVVICLELVLHQTAHIWHSHHWLCMVVNTANGASLSRFGEVAFLLTLVQWKLAAILYVARPQRKSSWCSRKCRHFFSRLSEAMQNEEQCRGVEKGGNGFRITRFNCLENLWLIPKLYIVYR